MFAVRSSWTISGSGNSPGPATSIPASATKTVEDGHRVWRWRDDSNVLYAGDYTVKAPVGWHLLRGIAFVNDVDPGVITAEGYVNGPCTWDAV